MEEMSSSRLSSSNFISFFGDLATLCELYLYQSYEIRKANLHFWFAKEVDVILNRRNRVLYVLLKKLFNFVEGVNSHAFVDLFSRVI
jgi:hypothetical protein